MKDSDKIKITEGDLLQNESVGDHPKILWERLKKPVIYFLMTVVCVLCFYLIFKPKDNKIVEEAGFNADIPQAKDGQLQSDKQKAYEQQLLEQKNEEKREAITTLSDYWEEQNNVNQNSNQSSLSSIGSGLLQSDQNAVNSYRNAQQALTSFYSRDDNEVNNLRKEISRLKNESMQNNSSPAGLGISDQLELMEKSYQMAARYLPSNLKQDEILSKEKGPQQAEEKKVQLTPTKSARPVIVSSLYRELSDSVFIEGLREHRFYGIITDAKRGGETKNSISGIVYETTTLTNESILAIRLSENMELGRKELPKGTLLFATAKFQGGRLQLKISSIEYQGNVYPVDISVHDNDGQLGLYVSYSPEQNTISDILGNMSQTSGTNIMMTQSAGQQVAADLSRGVVQGVSGYFQKRIRQLKVTVKAGHKVLLVSKNN